MWWNRRKLDLRLRHGRKPRFCQCWCWRQLRGLPVSCNFSIIDTADTALGQASDRMWTYVRESPAPASEPLCLKNNCMSLLSRRSRTCFWICPVANWLWFCGFHSHCSFPVAGAVPPTDPVITLCFWFTGCSSVKTSLSTSSPITPLSWQISVNEDTPMWWGTGGRKASLLNAHNINGFKRKPSIIYARKFEDLVYK